MSTSVRDLLIYKPDQFIAEYELAAFIYGIASTPVTKIDAIISSDPETGLKHKQPLAVEMACKSSLSILTGAAGTGKSTTTRCIVDSWQKAGLRVAVACPTGKAAKRSSELINTPARIEAGDAIECLTIHRLLGVDRETGSFKHNRAYKFSTFDALIIDEYPFLGNLLARDLFEALEPGQHRVLLCGDPNQLPPVDAGNLGRDLLGMPGIPFIELDVVLRQGADSGIVQNANLVLRGKQMIAVDPATGQRFTDCFFTPTRSEDETLAKILAWVDKEIPKARNFNAVKDIQVISPGKKSICGTKNINEKLRDLLNGGQKRQALGFRLGDKVINNQNDSRLGIVNGDVGIVIDMRVTGSFGHKDDQVNSDDDKYQAFITVDFGEGAGKDGSGLVEFNAESAANLSLALSFTVHKSQGSEFPVVVAPLHMCHALLLNRNMLYTLMTRPRELLCMIGDPRALQKAIFNDKPSKRRTRLRSILNSLFSKGSKGSK